MSKEEILEEDEDELFEEDLDEVLESEDEEEREEIPKNSRLNQILANPWKDVSLDQRNELSSVSLEGNFKKRNFNEEPEEQINYSPSLEETDRKYQAAGIQGEFKDNFVSEEERNLNEQRRLYENPKSLRPERRTPQEKEKEFFSREDMIKSNYLTKKKFF